MPRLLAALFEVGFDYGLNRLWSAQDSAENAASTVATVVSVTTILLIALRVALFEAAAKSLRRSVPPIVRTLRALALAALRVAGTGVQAVLVTLIEYRLIATVVAITAVVTIAAIISVGAVSAVVAIVIAAVVIDARALNCLFTANGLFAAFAFAIVAPIAIPGLIV